MDTKFWISTLAFFIGTIFGHVIVDIYHTHKAHKRDKE